QAVNGCLVAAQTTAVSRTGSRLVIGNTASGDAVGLDATTYQVVTNSVGTTLGQAQVVVTAANTVSVADYHNSVIAYAIDLTDQVVQLGTASRFDFRLVEIKQGFCLQVHNNRLSRCRGRCRCWSRCRSLNYRSRSWRCTTKAVNHAQRGVVHGAVYKLAGWQTVTCRIETRRQVVRDHVRQAPP